MRSNYKGVRNYMLREVTKTIGVITTDMRSYNVIETFWEKYPYYFEVKSPLTFIDGDLEIDDAFTGDYIVWDSEKHFKVMKASTWNKIYGDYLKGNIQEHEKSIQNKTH